MFLGLEFSNFKSFKNPMQFDLVAPKNRVRRRYPNNYVVMDSGELILKDAVIAGENAGGKSNFVAVFKFMKALFLRNDVIPRARRDNLFSGNVRGITSTVNSDDETDSVESFAIELALGQETIKYSLVLDEQGIVLERLEKRVSARDEYELYFESHRSRMDEDDFGLGARYSLTMGRDAYSPEDEKSSELVEQLFHFVQRGNNLMIVALAALGECYARQVVSWFTSELVIASRAGAEFVIEGIQEDEIKEILTDSKYFDIFKLVDKSIIDIRIDPDRPFKDSILVRRTNDGCLYERPIREDSTGVLQFAQWAMVIYLVVYKNKTVIADEIDSAINPVLSDRVMAYINGRDHTGQFIFTTHNVFNLTFRTFMKEQMYFVTKDVETLESSLYSLADFKDLRYDVKGEIYELYLCGLLGGTLNE